MDITVCVEEEGSEFEEQRRILKALDDLFVDSAKQEEERRKVWLLEEEERRRRIREEGNPTSAIKEERREKVQGELLEKFSLATTAVAEERERAERMLPEIEEEITHSLLKEILQFEARILEEQERARRIIEEKDRTANPITEEQLRQDDIHEQVQEQFMSTVHRKQMAKEEEIERQRRIAEEEQLLEEEKEDLDAERTISYIATVVGEERERQRRIMGDCILEAEEEIRREMLRRSTWMEEERERRRRIMAMVSDDMEEAIHREIMWREVKYLEEKARKEQLKDTIEKVVHPTEQDEKQLEAHSRVQEQFMSVVHRKEAAQAEEEERQRRIKEDELKQIVNSEMDRRLTWILEERERTRRVLEDLAQDYVEQVNSTYRRVEAARLEDLERARRIRAEKTKAPDFLAQVSDSKELVQQQLVGQVHRKEVALMEEKERERRIQQENREVLEDEAFNSAASKVDRVVTRGLEEQEKQRRITEELQREVELSLQREMERRKVWIMEEEERQRRILAEKGHHSTEQTAKLIKDTIQSINKQLDQQLLEREGIIKKHKKGHNRAKKSKRTRDVTHDVVRKWMEELRSGTNATK